MTSPREQCKALLYGNPDCQASKGFAKHISEGDADFCCCKQTFSRWKGPRRPQIHHISYRTLSDYILLVNHHSIVPANVSSCEWVPVLNLNPNSSFGKAADPAVKSILFFKIILVKFRLLSGCWKPNNTLRIVYAGYPMSKISRWQLECTRSEFYYPFIVDEKLWSSIIRLLPHPHLSSTMGIVAHTAQRNPLH